MIYSVINQKGGVGKSTTAAALWAGLNLKGYKALAIDLDAQGNLTYSAKGQGGKTALSLLTGEASAREIIQSTGTGDIITSSKALAGADAFITGKGKENRLKDAMQDIIALYDYIIIDTPPALGILTVNALTACNSVIIPAQPDIFSLQGIDQLIETMQPVKEYCNKELSIAGILLTRCNARQVLARDITAYLKQIAAQLDTKLFETTIREGVAIKEAQAQQKSIFDYAARAKVTADYNAFIAELLGKGG